MNQLNEAISKIGVVPVIKLSNPERDAAPLAKALCEEYEVDAQQAHDDITKMVKQWQELGIIENS